MRLLMFFWGSKGVYGTFDVFLGGLRDGMRFFNSTDWPVR